MYKKKKPAEVIRGELTFWGVYVNYKGDVIEYGRRSWIRVTHTQHDAILLNHIVPALKNHDFKPISEYTLRDFEEAMASIKRKGKASYKGIFVPFKQSTLDKDWYLMEAVVATAAKNCLCENCFQEEDGATAGRSIDPKNMYRLRRTPKSLSVTDDVKLAYHLINHAEKEGDAAGLLLMYAAGVRNNEACGANFDDIRELKEFPGHYYLLVVDTTEIDSNVLKFHGKNNNSYRRIPIPHFVYLFFMKIKKERVELASSNGYTGNGGDLPIACKNGDPTRRCSTSDLSNAARTAFVSIGMRDEDIGTLEQEIGLFRRLAREELDEDEFKELEADPTAYLLRRNFATNMAILGLSDVEIQYVMGHKIRSQFFQRNDFNNERRLFAVKQKMDQRPVLNTVFAKELVIEKLREKVPFSGSRKTHIKIPMGDHKSMRIRATAREPQDTIAITVTANIDGEVHCEAKTYSSQLPGGPSRAIDVNGLYQEAFLKAMEAESNS